MGLSDGKRFLVAANRAAQDHDYFSWRAVGRTLDWPETRSRQVLASLNERQLVIVLHGEETRLLPAGRKLAEQLTAPESRRNGMSLK